MKNLKILHLANDEKFIDQAFKAFEQIAPGKNYLYLISKEKPKLVKSQAKIISNLQAMTCPPQKGLLNHDIIVIHSLNPDWFNIIKKFPKDKVLIWLGWGYDYYDILHESGSELLLPLTKKAWKEAPQKESLITKSKNTLKKLLSPVKKQSIIKRIDIFAPVLPSEYGMVKEKFLPEKFPKQAIWNYGNLEDDLVKGFTEEKVTGNAILVGNSASAENNHIDSFALLSNLKIGSRKVISPLSYGNQKYRDLVLNEGRKQLGNQFIALTEFMPISEYVSILKTCSFVIMNHMRQQAVGNIVIMLYLGAKVFLQKDCPTFTFFKQQGAKIFSIQELEQSPSLLNQKLDEKSQAINKEIVIENWSREVSNGKTQRLLEQAYQIKNER